MGRSADWLSEKQLETLQWVKDGCHEAGDEVGYERRISARSLAHRGLARIAVEVRHGARPSRRRVRND